MSRRRLYILGTSGLAKEMAQLADTINRGSSEWEFRGFVGGAPEDVGRDLGWGRVLGDDEWLLAGEGPADLIVGIGYPSIRARVLARYLAVGIYRFPTLVHPTATLDQDQVRLGRGNIVTAGCVFTCDITAGDFNLFNWNMTVGHDARIGDYCVMNPSVNLSGNVTLGDRVLLGAGAQVLERLVVANDATVGAGAVVTRDVPAGATVVGVPARPLERALRPLGDGTE